MKHFPVTSAAIVLIAGLINNAFANPLVEATADALEHQFQQFEQTHSQCRAQAEATKLDDDAIASLSSLPGTTGEALGFLSQKAIRQCSLSEYAELMRLLLTLEALNRNAEQPARSALVERYKILLFPLSETYAEQAYRVLPQEQKAALQQIDALSQPFNLVDAFERAWLTE